MHGAGLYNDRYGTFRLTEQRFTLQERLLVDEFLADMQHLQDELLAGTGHRTLGHAADDPEVRALYLALQVKARQVGISTPVYGCRSRTTPADVPPRPNQRPQPNRSTP